MIEKAVLDPGLAAIIIAIFGVFWIVLGWWIGRSNKSLDDFMLAGRNVGLGLATATAMATWVTSNTTMVAPQLTYQLGIWGMVGYSLGAVGLLLFAPLAKRIREIMPHGFTSGDFIRRRYGPLAWHVFLVISFFYALGWLITLGMAGGVLVEALSGIPYVYGMSVIVAVCTLYTVFGGLKAVIGTDFVQTVIILVGVAVIAYLILGKVSFEEIHTSLEAERPGLLNLLLPASLMFLFNNLFFGVGEIFHSNVWWSRAFAFGKNVGFRAYLLGGLLWLPVPIVAGFVALAAPALGVNVPAADMVAPLVAGQVLGEVGAILVFIVVFAALASSLDSVLAATSDLITNDIVKGHFWKTASAADLRRVATLVILGLGVAVWLVCLFRVSTLGQLLQFTGAFVASTIWPVALGLKTKRMGDLGAALAMAAGTGIGLWAFFEIGFYTAALVSTAVSLVITTAFALLDGTRFDFARLSADTQEARP